MLVNQLFTIIMFILVGLLMVVPFDKYKEKNTCLDIKNMNILKGVSCVLVVISHISLQLGGKGILILTSSVGYLAVGIFFFSSGYGLMYSFISKENYLKGFLQKRVLKIVIPFWITNIIFLLVYIIIYKEHYTYLDILKYIFGIKLICGHAWFMIFLICFYILFWAIGKLFKKDKYIIALMTIIILSFSLLIGFKIIKYGDFGKNILAFPIGMLMAKYNTKVREYIDNKYNNFTVLSTILFFITYGYYTVIKWHIGMENNLLINYIVDFICQMSFINMMLMLVQKIRIKSKVTIFVSSISYEIYLMHQLGLDIAKYIFRNWYDAIIIFAGIILSVMLGFILNILIQPIWKINDIRSKREI